MLGATVYRTLTFITGDAHVVVVTATITDIILGPLDSSYTRIRSSLHYRPV